MMLNINKLAPIALTAITLLITPAHCYAHAVVTYNSLKSEIITPNTAKQIRLNFNSKIELDLSQIILVSAGDKMQLLKAEYGKKPGSIVISLPPLNEGEYAIKLKIFAADGHLSEDLLRFFIKSPAK
jgi:copper resistance protein C